MLIKIHLYIAGKFRHLFLFHKWKLWQKYWGLPGQLERKQGKAEQSRKWRHRLKETSYTEIGNEGTMNITELDKDKVPESRHSRQVKKW